MLGKKETACSPEAQHTNSVVSVQGSEFRGLDWFLKTFRAYSYMLCAFTENIHTHAKKGQPSKGTGGLFLEGWGVQTNKPSVGRIWITSNSSTTQLGVRCIVCVHDIVKFSNPKPKSL